MLECFIVKEGAEKKAELEDILPLIDDTGIEFIFMDVLSDPDIDVSYALAHIAAEIKEKVYRNLTMRVRHRIEKEVKAIESYERKYNYWSEKSREKLISFIGEKKSGCLSDNPEQIVWKEKVYKIETPEKNQPDHSEEMKKIIEEAFNSGALSISVKDLSAASGLFEKGGIKELEIYGEFDGTWPEFLDNCRTLTSIYLNINKGLTEFPSWIRNGASLCRLSIWGPNISLLPDWIGDLQSLTDLELHCYNTNNFKELPDSIGNLKNLAKLNISNSGIEKLPDNIGNISSLEELKLYNNRRLISLPDSIGNLKNLAVLTISISSIETLPGGIGDMEKLTDLSLRANSKLKCLPDSIGKLKNLKTLDVSGSAIEKLPDTLSNCASLECVDICHTSVKSYPDFLSSIKSLKQTTEVMPIKNVHSRISFCNSYYTLTASLIQFAMKAKREGLLALGDELCDLPDIFFREGLNLMVNGADAEVIQRILTLKIEREHNHYRKRLKLMVMEGILYIRRFDSIPRICIKLCSMANIKNNPLDVALAKYLSGDFDAFDYINFRASPWYLTILTRLNTSMRIKRPKNCEIIRFIKRAVEILKIYKKELLPGLEKNLDNDGIMARDVFEFGLCLMVEYWNDKEIDKVLTMLIDDETDPARKNFALAKKEAVGMVSKGEIEDEFVSTLLAYFDDDVTEEYSGVQL